MKRAGLFFWRAGLLIAGALLLQNCTQPVANNGPSELEKLAMDLPFAYDAKIDQIAHLSCSDLHQDNTLGFSTSAYFTIRAGAYRSGGLQLNQAFYDAIGHKQLDKQAEILSNSPANANTVMQLSMRSRSGYQTLNTRTGSVLVGQDYSNMLAPLGLPEVSQLLVNQPEGSMTRHIRSGRAGGYRFEGDLVFADNYTLWNDFKTKMGSNFLLTQTYTQGGTGNDKEYSARSPSDLSGGTTTSSVNRDSSVFGMGYQLGFTVPSGRTSNYQYAVLASVTEKSLQNEAISGSWTCPIQLRVVKSEDAGTAIANCSKHPDPTNLTGAEAFKLQIIRNSFRQEDWYVDITKDGSGNSRDCIISKRADPNCYGTTTPTVSYTIGDPCTTTGEVGKNHCLAFGSICYRN